MSGSSPHVPVAFSIRFDLWSVVLAPEVIKWKITVFHGDGFSLIAFLIWGIRQKNDTIVFVSSSWFEICKFWPWKANFKILPWNVNFSFFPQARSSSGQGQIMTQVGQYAQYPLFAPFARLYLHSVLFRCRVLSNNSTSSRIIKAKCIIFGIGRGPLITGPISMPGAHTFDRGYALGQILDTPMVMGGVRLHVRTCRCANLSVSLKRLNRSRWNMVRG